MVRKGKKCSKDTDLPECIGTLDELIVAHAMVETNIDIQRILYKINAMIYTNKKDDDVLKEISDETGTIENIIDEIQKKLPPLTDFVVPCRQTYWHHNARTIARRAERRFVRICSDMNEDIFRVSEQFLNRLSDFYFVLAREYQHNENIEEDLLKFK